MEENVDSHSQVSRHGISAFRYFPDARGSGVPQTKAALFARDGKITSETVLGKFFCSHSCQRHPARKSSPSVQVGGGIASMLGRCSDRVKALLPVGASAAVAAAFNTPLAAVVFSLEEITGDLNAPVLGSVVLASAASWLMLRLLLDNHPLFQVRTLCFQKESRHGRSGWHRVSPAEKDFMVTRISSWSL